MPRPPLASLASCFEVEELVCGQRLCGDGRCYGVTVTGALLEL